MTTRIAIAGGGRMGKAIAAQIRKHPKAELAGIWTRGADLAGVLRDADVIVDFSLPDGTTELCNHLMHNFTPLVCGVSGLGADHIERFRQLAQRGPVVYDRNMSQGIAALAAALDTVASTLGPEFELRIEETHHVHKIDAPSGTAIQLGEQLAELRGLDFNALEIHSEREGEVPGDHKVILSSADERLTFEHHVKDRSVFAAGAVRAALWAPGQPAGQYTMRDVLRD